MEFTKRHKIALMVSNLCTLGGTERVTVKLSEELVREYDCYILTQWKAGEYAYPIAENVKIFNLYDRKRRFRYSVIDTVRRFREYIRREGIEVVIVVGRNNGLYPLLVKMVTDVKLIYCEHSTPSSYLFFKEETRQKVYRRLLQFLMKRVPDLVVALTEKTLHDYKDAKVPCCCIYNMLDENLLDSRGAYHCENRSIITVGRVEYGKGIDFLLEVAGKVFARHPDWHWDIYGEGEEEYVKHIRDLIVENGLEKHVFLKGKCDHMYDMYSHYGIYVMTSRYEGLGMVLLEAKAKKLPLVSFDIHAGPSDIIRDGVDGYLVPPFDTDAMAEKLCHLIEHPEVRRDFSDHAYGNIDKFRKDAILEKWKDLIEGMCEE